jgi:hypothetical protein
VAKTLWFWFIQVRVKAKGSFSSWLQLIIMGITPIIKGAGHAVWFSSTGYGLFGSPEEIDVALTLL